MTGIAPHFVEWIRQQLIQKADKYGFDIYRDGLSVYTTLDSRMQRAANRAVMEHLAEYQSKFLGQWNWKNHKDELAQSASMAISDAAAGAAVDKARYRECVRCRRRAFQALCWCERATLEKGAVRWLTRLSLCS